LQGSWKKLGIGSEGVPSSRDQEGLKTNVIIFGVSRDFEATGGGGKGRSLKKGATVATGKGLS